MKNLTNVVNNLMLVGTMALGAAALEKEANAQLIHTQPGAQQIFSDNFSTPRNYGAFNGWTHTNGTLRSTSNSGLLAAYNLFDHGLEHVELQARVRLGNNTNAPFRMEMALYEINVGSFYSALFPGPTNKVSVVETTDMQPVWRDETNGLAFANNSWHDVSFVKNGTELQTYIDGRLVLEGDAINNYPVNSFNITFQKLNGNPGTPAVEIDDVKVWTKTTPRVPALDIDRAVMLTWPTNPPTQLLSSRQFDGVYSVVTNDPSRVGTNYQLTLPARDANRHFKLLFQD